MIGFVHNPDSNPIVLLDSAQALLACVHAAAGRRLSAGFAGGRWLVIAAEEETALIEAYRSVCSQLSAPTGFERILMVTAGGRVEVLAG